VRVRRMTNLAGADGECAANLPPSSSTERLRGITIITMDITRFISRFISRIYQYDSSYPQKI